MRTPAFIAALCGLASPAFSQCDWAIQSTSGPSARSYFGFAYDSARQRAVLFGGTSGNGETWEWDGASWSRRATSGPPPRASGALAYDAARARTVLFGGLGGPTELNDTWLWDGTSWTQAPGAAPPARHYHGMAYDGATQRVVMGGGQAGVPATILSDWWQWNGTSWAQGATGSSPQGFNVMTYDSVRQRVVCLDSYALKEYNGTTWAAFGGPNGGATLGPAFAYDASSATTVVLGGENLQNGTPSSLMAQWNGSAWAYGGGAVPSARVFAGMVFDSARGRLVLFGGTGNTAGGNAADLRETWGFPFAYLSGQPQPVSVEAGSPAGFSVSTDVTGSAYQWRRNGVALANGGHFSGVTTASLSINPAGLDDAGSYDVVLTGPCGPMTSAAAALTVSCYANCDHSTQAPILNVADFACFLQKYANGCQ